jgi:hypothetical protein
MNPREREILKAIAKALRGNPAAMDALATSYPLPEEYVARKVTIRERAAMFLTVLTDV